MRSLSRRTLRLRLWVMMMVIALAFGGQGMGHRAAPLLAAPVEQSGDARAAKVDQLFTNFIGKAEPGAAVIVIQRGKVLYKAAYGLADLEQAIPLTPRHLFHIGSVGKQFTAIAIMQLYQAGKLSYDASIRTYLPALPAWGDSITIRQLLHHTSGLPDYTDALIDQMLARSEMPTNRDLIAALTTLRELPRAPGEEFEYSNVGYDLLGSIVERVSGQSFANYLDRQIFRPLGMTQSFSLPNAAKQAGKLVAHSYEAADSEPYDWDPLDGLVGSGSIYSTVDDLYRYDQALYHDKLVKQTVLAEAFQPGILQDGTKTDYGFAFELEQWQKRAYVAHSGAWLAFESDYVRFPKEQLSVFVLLNRNYAIPDEPRIGVQVAAIYLK